ncbi:nuclear transport factor 2 family protein [soil metagenome]
MTAHTDADVLAVVERSPLAAARHDRSGWVGLFTVDGRVEDPVGSAPHRGHHEIGLFFDTFIAPRDITVCSVADIVCGVTVVRDVTLVVRMGTQVTMTIPAILRYTVREVGNDIKIDELQAFWELPAMLGQFARNGLRAVPVTVGLTRALLSNQGVGGALGFLRGLHRPARRHHRQVEALVTALTGGDQLTARRILHDGAGITLGDQLPMTTDALGARLRGARVVTRLTAGWSTAVSVRTDEGPGVLLIDTGDWMVRYYG